MNSFKIANFRVFDSEGTVVDFSPVTILTGANSSGKSSFVKSLVLFRDWLEGMRDRYLKDGSYDPVHYPMDFSRADLKLKGFKGCLNRNVPESSRMVFSIDVEPLAYQGVFTVEYSFAPSDDSSIQDVGILDSIRIIHQSKEFFVARRDGDELRATFFSGFDSQFWMFEAFDNIPCENIEMYSDELDPFDVERFISSPRGAMMAKVFDGLAVEVEDVMDVRRKHRIPNRDVNRYPNLFGRDNLRCLAESRGMGTMFYFPLLERFKGVGRDECIRILREESIVPESQNEGLKRVKLDKESVINAFAESGEESFISYYVGLENSFLHNLQVMGNGRIHMLGGSYNFIKDLIENELSMDISERGLEPSPFSEAYKLLSLWQWAEDEAADARNRCQEPGGNSHSSQTYDSEFISRYLGQDGYSFRSEHYFYRAYKEFVDYLLHALLLPPDLSRFSYFNGSFANVKRLHSFEERSLFVQIARDYINRSGQYNRRRHLSFFESQYSPGDFMKKWLSELGIGEELIIDMDDEGLGFKMYLSGRKGKESLADCGHGVTQIVSILLMIESAIMEYEMQKGDREPIFGKTIYERLTDSIIAIEEPEVSLHPNYQSKLASMFEDASCNYGVRISFIIETHSEYLVRKTQTIVARYNDDKFKENPFSVYYFNEDGTAYRVEYTRSGRFANSFGPGFVDEADNLAMSLLSIKVSN